METFEIEYKYYYYPNGEFSRIKNYKDGILNGENFSFYKNGYMKYIKNYNNNKKDGIYKKYYRNGLLYKYKNYKDGNCIEYKKYNPLGIQIRDVKYENKKKYMDKKYSDDGLIKSHYMYIDMNKLDDYLNIKNKDTS
jgi:antitoxin component YwqK of YwqJK toxin-antitoxin module